MEGPPLYQWTQQEDPYRPPPQPVLPPAAWVGPRPLDDPGGAKLLPGRNLPPRLSATPQTWVQCLLSHSNASNEGPRRRPRCEQSGPWEGSCPLSPVLTLPGERRASQGRRGPVPPLRMSDRVSDRGCVRTSSFLSATCLPPAQRALRHQEHIYFQSETISPRERMISEKISEFRSQPDKVSFFFFSPSFPPPRPIPIILFRVHVHGLGSRACVKSSRGGRRCSKFRSHFCI